MQQALKEQVNILSCARYAYRPNKLTYCGPDQNKELFQYIINEDDDGGLGENLKKFETLYPYLRHIAHTNKRDTIYSADVVRAYWVGNNLLRNTGNALLYYHLIDDLNLKKKLPKKEIELIGEKIPKGANAHHSFHVFNIWKRTGYIENPHTLYTMDECRIGWGRVKEIKNNIIKVLYRPLVFKEAKLAFGSIEEKDIFYELNNVEVAIGDWVSFHWSSFCDRLCEEDIKNIKYWTTINLQLANYGR